MLKSSMTKLNYSQKAWTWKLGTEKIIVADTQLIISIQRNLNVHVLASPDSVAEVQLQAASLD